MDNDNTLLDPEATPRFGRHDSEDLEENEGKVISEFRTEKK